MNDPQPNAERPEVNETAPSEAATDPPDRSSIAEEAHVLSTLKQEADRLRRGRRLHRRTLFAFAGMVAGSLLLAGALLLHEISRTVVVPGHKTMGGYGPDSGRRSTPSSNRLTSSTFQSPPVAELSSPPPAAASSSIVAIPSSPYEWDRVVRSLPWDQLVVIVLVSGAVLVVALRALRVQKRAAGALARLDVLAAVGPLSEALRIDDTAMRRLAEDALTRLLPRLKASDSQLLNAEQHACLYQSLRSRNSAFLLALLVALEQIGDGRAVLPVQRLAEGEGAAARDKRVREAAQTCLPYLLARAETDRWRQTLLRPVCVPGQSADRLLRPVEGVAPHDPAVLLRPSQKEG